MSCAHTQTLGVYLLGALDPGERVDFDRHLDGCPVCQAELLRLSPLPGLLNRVTLDDLADVDDHPGVTPLVAPTPAPEPAPRPRRRHLAVAAVVLIALGLGGVVGYAASPAPTPPPVASATWTAVNPVNGAKADLDLTSHRWGTELQIRLRDVPPGKPCKLVVRGNDGYRETAGWWGSTDADGEWIMGSTSIDLARIDRVEVVVGSEVLVGIPRAG